ncbi:MobA/MobL family protein [uncultured Cohaesibacter sp.]|uniref:MobA/MobL family protein n=1 Tax=uncultured Cohaesibacter sp. TaxID=1002546 RepID=UPI002930DDA5|nr:MobA/MobL family protein [uncultured Cohaesibacter sp.]
MANDQDVTWESIHCHADNVSRKQGHSAVAAAAYNTRARLTDKRTRKIHRYTRKKTDIICSGLLAIKGAPAWATNRADFWNRVEAQENRKDARVAKTIEVSIPRDVPQKLWQNLIEEFTAPFVAKGLVVDYAIHDDGSGHNPHCHILLPTRPLSEDGFADYKLAELNAKSFLYDIREAWANVCNKFLKANGSSIRLDHRSHKARGLTQPPTRHRGKQSRAQEPHFLHKEQPNMAKRPTYYDKKDFPNLTNRDDWPPQFQTPSPDMTDEERQELADYWERKLQEQKHTQTQENDGIWGENKQQAADIQEILEIKARSLPITHDEQALLNDVREHQPEEVAEVEHQIIRHRMNKLQQEQDLPNPDHVEEQYHQAMQKQRDRLLGYTPKEQQRIVEARQHSETAVNRVRDEILAERVEDHHKRLDDLPREEQWAHLGRLARAEELKLSASQKEQLREAAEIARYENNKGIYNMAREHILKNEIELLKSQDEQLQKQELERQYDEQEKTWQR